eukprot:1651713-Rhodomonas_salina.1
MVPDSIKIHTPSAVRTGDTSLNAPLPTVAQASGPVQVVDSDGEQDSEDEERTQRWMTAGLGCSVAHAGNLNSGVEALRIQRGETVSQLQRLRTSEADGEKSGRGGGSGEDVESEEEDEDEVWGREHLADAHAARAAGLI